MSGSETDEAGKRRGRVKARARKAPSPVDEFGQELRERAAEVRRSLIVARIRVRRTRHRIESEVRETAAEVKRRVAKAKLSAKRTADRIETEVRETAAEVKRRVAKAKLSAKRTADRIETEVRETAADVKRRVGETRLKARTTAGRIETEMRETAAKVRRRVDEARYRAKRTAGKIEDEARFLKHWFENPLLAGAVSPSGPDLAREMAAWVDPALPGPVVELGPGTGPVTEALLARGVPTERLLLVEYDPEFCALLEKRFAGVTVVQGDAYDLERTLDARLAAPAAAVVSSLPLFTKPPAQRLALLGESFGLMRPGAPFVQFTYAAVSPMPLRAGGFTAEASKRIWRNVPPARVWVYRRRPQAAARDLRPSP